MSGLCLVLFLLLEVVPKAEPESIAAPLHNATWIGDW